MIKIVRIPLALLTMCIALVGCAGTESAQEYLNEARTHYENRDLDLARVQLRNALRIEPNLVDAHYLQAQLHEVAENYRGMHGALEHVLSLQPDHWDAGFDLAKISLLTNDIERAASLAEAAHSAKPDSVEALVLMGAVRLQQRDPVASFKFAEQALQLDPTNPDAVTLMVHHQVNGLEFNAALSSVDAALVKAPDHRILHLLGVSIAGQKDDRANVLERLNAMIVQFPDDQNLRNTLARTHITKGNYDAARSVLAKSVSDLPDNLDAMVTYAKFLAVEDTDQAAHTLREFINTSSAHQNELRFLLAEILLSEGSTDEAAIIYEVISDEGVGETAARASNQLASMALMRNDRASAQAMLVKALKSDPGNPDALLRRAHMKLLRRETDSAIADIRIVLRDDPSSADAYAQLGRSYLQHQSADLAEQAFGNAITLNETHPYAAVELAKIYMARQDFAKAVEVLSVAQPAHPSNADLTQLRIMTELALANHSEAERLASNADAQTLGKNYKDLITGISLQLEGNYDAAIATFKEILNVNPNANRGVLEALVQSYQNSGQPKELKSYLEGFVQQHPDSTTARELLALNYRKEGRLEDSEQLVRDGLTEEWLKGHELLAALLVEQDRPDEALAVYESIVAEKPESLGLQLQLATLVEGLGDERRAKQLYEHILEANPAVDIAANNLAMLLANSGNIEQALTLARRFENSNVPYFLDTLGWIQHLNGNHAKAVELFNRAISIAPNNAEIRYHAGVANLALKRNAEAKENLQLALELLGPGETFDGIEDANRMLATLI